MAEQIDVRSDDWLTTREAARISPYTWGTIRQYCSRGTLKAVQRSGIWFIHKDDLLAYVERMKDAGQQKHTPKAKREAGD